MSLTSPITLMEMDKSDDALDRVVSAGQQLSNLAYHVAANGGIVTREQWRLAQDRWDTAVTALRRVQRSASKI
jgi:hypothetical protein